MDNFEAPSKVSVRRVRPIPLKVGGRIWDLIPSIFATSIILNKFAKTLKKELGKG